MVVNDNAQNRMLSGALRFFASKLAPTGSRDHLHLTDRFPPTKPSAKVRGFSSLYR